MHYVVTIDIKRVKDAAGSAPSFAENKRGEVVDLAHIVVKDAELERLKIGAKAHLELITDI